MEIFLLFFKCQNKTKCTAFIWTRALLNDCESGERVMSGTQFYHSHRSMDIGQRCDVNRKKVEIHAHRSKERIVRIENMMTQRPNGKMDMK